MGQLQPMSAARGQHLVMLDMIRKLQTVICQVMGIERDPKPFRHEYERNRHLIVPYHLCYHSEAIPPSTELRRTLPYLTSHHFPPSAFKLLPS